MIIINSRQNLTGLQSLWFLQISRVYRLFRPDVNGGPGHDLAGLSNVVPVLESEDQCEVLCGLPALVARVARLCCVCKLEVTWRSARGQPGGSDGCKLTAAGVASEHKADVSAEQAGLVWRLAEEGHRAARSLPLSGVDGLVLEVVPGLHHVLPQPAGPALLLVLAANFVD